jgi:copper chaperone CopZ
MKTLLRSRELTCPSCIAKIENALNKIDGVDKAKVHFNTGRIEVDHNGVADEKLVDAVRHAGYNAQVAAF